MQSTRIFIDLQGYHVKSEFIVKDCAIITNGLVSLYSFEMQYKKEEFNQKERKTINWVERNLYHIMGK